MDDDLVHRILLWPVRKQRIPARGLKPISVVPASHVVKGVAAVRKQRIPARGLKLVLPVAHRGRCACQKTTNPREGIETLRNCCCLYFSNSLCQKTTNPREGIETLRVRVRPEVGAHLVRKQRIPARGLKLKEMSNVGVVFFDEPTSQKTTNPREGIETGTRLQPATDCLGESENNESPRGD